LFNINLSLSLDFGEISEGMLKGFVIPEFQTYELSKSILTFFILELELPTFSFYD
jgi:hypothetical protein